ncbi:hypothetical protein P4S64_06295 [Vibrio sp. M60_M31a]
MQDRRHLRSLKRLIASDVPWVGIVVMAGCTSIPFLFLDIDSLIVLVIAATTSWLLAYMVAHINVNRIA